MRKCKFAKYKKITILINIRVQNGSLNNEKNI